MGLMAREGLYVAFIWTTWDGIRPDLDQKLEELEQKWMHIVLAGRVGRFRSSVACRLCRRFLQRCTELSKKLNCSLNRRLPLEHYQKVLHVINELAEEDLIFHLSSKTHRNQLSVFVRWLKKASVRTMPSKPSNNQYYWANTQYQYQYTVKHCIHFFSANIHVHNTSLPILLLGQYAFIMSSFICQFSARFHTSRCRSSIDIGYDSQ